MTLSGPSCVHPFLHLASCFTSKCVHLHFIHRQIQISGPENSDRCRGRNVLSSSRPNQRRWSIFEMIKTHWPPLGNIQNSYGRVNCTLLYPTPRTKYPVEGFDIPSRITIVAKKCFDIRLYTSFAFYSNLNVKKTRYRIPILIPQPSQELLLMRHIASIFVFVKLDWHWRTIRR